VYGDLTMPLGSGDVSDENLWWETGSRWGPSKSWRSRQRRLSPGPSLNEARVLESEAYEHLDLGKAKKNKARLTTDRRYTRISRRRSGG
jgi:hypothetical protein